MDQAKTPDISPEELNKAIDTLLEEVFEKSASGELKVEKTPEEIEKAGDLDVYAASKTTADAVVNAAPKMQNDTDRPTQISDVPQKDMDGARASEYTKITSNADKEKENEEAKKQSAAVDQVSTQGHQSAEPKPTAIVPIMKAEGAGSTPIVTLETPKEENMHQISSTEYEAFQIFKKAQADENQEKLIKSVVETVASKFMAETERLRKALSDQGELIKAIAKRPQASKSIEGIEQLNKAIDLDTTTPETFSKSEKLDAAFALAKAGKIEDVIVSELEMTGSVSDAEARTAIEKYLVAS